MLNPAQLDELVNEKESAAETIGRHRAALQQVVSDRRHRELDPLVNTLIYTESFFEALRDMVGGLVAYRRFQKTRDPALAQRVKKKLFAAQDHWNHHTQRFGSLPGAATAFREEDFWDLTQDILAEVDA